MSICQSAIDVTDALELHYSHWLLATSFVSSLWSPLVLCEVPFRSPRGAQHSKREKPCRLSINSIAESDYWPHFLLNAYEERNNASYRGTVDLRLHTYQDSSEATSCYQREKPKTVHTASNKQAFHEKQLPCASQTLT